MMYKKEEIHRARSERVPSARALGPMELWSTSLGTRMCSPTQKLANLILWVFLWTLHHVGLRSINSIFSPSFLSREWGRGAESLKLLILGWSFWLPAPT